MPPETDSTLFWQGLAGLTALVAALSPVLVALVSHWRKPRPAASPGEQVPVVRSPSVSDAAAVQGMTLELATALRAQVRAEAEARLRAEIRADLAEAERDLAHGVLRAKDLPIPSLVHPSHREDHPHG